jgi:hypothetical protein
MHIPDYLFLNSFKVIKQYGKVIPVQTVEALRVTRS